MCGNCADDDGDGLIDLADPACCAMNGTMRLERLRLARRRARSGLALDAEVRGIDLAPARAGQDILLQLEAPGTPPFCARIPGTRLTAKKRALRFKDPRRTAASAGGVTRLRLHSGRNGTLALSAQGGAIGFVPPPSGPLEVRVGFLRADPAQGGSHCAGAGVSTGPRGRR